MIRKTLTVLASVTLLSFSLKAGIISGVVTGGTALTAGGSFVLLTPPLMNPFGPPDSVGNDNFQSPDLYAFAEQQDFLLTSDLTLDVGSTPIPAGTVVSSYYIFFDPGPTQNIIGNVNFGSEVLGIITSTTDLASSDFLAASGVNYLDPSERGLESGDSVTISGAQQILFSTTASSPGDYVRVITASPAISTPEPATWATIAESALLGLAALALRRRRRLS